MLALWRDEWQRPTGLGKHSQHRVLYPRYFGFGLFTIKRAIKEPLFRSLVFMLDSSRD